MVAGGVDFTENRLSPSVAGSVVMAGLESRGASGLILQVKDELVLLVSSRAPTWSIDGAVGSKAGSQVIVPAVLVDLDGFTQSLLAIWVNEIRSSPSLCCCINCS